MSLARAVQKHRSIAVLHPSYALGRGVLWTPRFIEQARPSQLWPWDARPRTTCQELMAQPKTSASAAKNQKNVESLHITAIRE